MLRPARSLAPLLITSALALASMTGCGDELDPELAEYDEDTIEIIENLELAGYPRADIEIVDDEVIVGGDALVTLEASREIASEFVDDDEDFRQYWTNNGVSADVEVICVDVLPLLAAPNIHIGALQALTMYNDLDLSFSMTAIFTGMSTDHCDAVINTSLKSGTSASAGFPSGGQPYDQIKMGTGIANYGINVSRHVFMHELGHCVGLRHSDYFNRSLSCGQGGAESSATHIPGTPDGFDPLSVMNSCYSANSMGAWSPFDIIALIMLYAA